MKKENYKNTNKNDREILVTVKIGQINDLAHQANQNS
jgi:hypothetical protein